MSDDRAAGDCERRQFEAAAMAVAQSLGRLTSQYGGAMVVAVTLQLLAGKAQQVGLDRAGFLATVGKAYDAQAGTARAGEP